MEGKWLGGRYQILKHVGGGGMAVVYKAMDTALGRHVAVKVMNDSLSHDEDFIRRFDREARAAGSLSHPNVVHVFDVGREGHIHYIVMEYIEGASLMDLIQKKGRIPAEEAAQIAAQVCDGLAHAHGKGIVHRDLKPHNVMCTLDGQYKLADFGISRTTGLSTITKTGFVMGSVHYFSPEQARGNQVSVRSDLYSLGVTLYEMVTGRLPFDGEEAVAIALKHLQEPVPDPRSVVPDLPESLCAVILKAMEKDPEQRFQSAKEMSDALRQLTTTGYEPPQQGEPQALIQPEKPRSKKGSPSLRNPEKRNTRMSQSRNGRKKGQKKKWVGLAVAIVLLLSLSYGIFSSGLFDTSGGLVDAEEQTDPTDQEKDRQAEKGSQAIDSPREDKDDETTPPTTSQKLSPLNPDDNDSREEKKGYDWQKEFWENGHPRFNNISSSGSEGVYQVTVETDLSPEFYYDVIIFDTRGERQVITRATVPTQGRGNGFKTIDFQVNVPDVPSKGLVKIRLYGEGGIKAYKILERRG
ncbi:protein kinase domain-containing protein [Kroppenstedtia guangzhouensis]|nr:protein kinase [Kroppenstedtia guangzhouensis]